MFDPCYLIIVLLAIRNKDNVFIFNLVKLENIAISLTTVTTVTLIMAFSRLYLSTLSNNLIYSKRQKAPCVVVFRCACVCVRACVSVQMHTYQI